MLLSSAQNCTDEAEPTSCKSSSLAFFLCSSSTKNGNSRAFLWGSKVTRSSSRWRRRNPRLDDIDFQFRWNKRTQPKSKKRNRGKASSVLRQKRLLSIAQHCARELTISLFSSFSLLTTPIPNFHSIDYGKTIEEREKRVFFFSLFLSSRQLSNYEPFSARVRAR